jgi:outer membrane protein OmpA-like peptidoglycan-associated protein
MREILLGSVAAIAMAGSANAATGWYMSLGAGENWIPKGDYRSFSSGVETSNGSFSYDSGYIVSGAVGFDFGDHWRTEFEVAYRDNNVKSYTSGGEGPFTTSAQVWELSQMVNVLYDVPLGGNWEASVGAGVGGNLVVLKNWEDSSGTQQDDYVVAGQLIAQAAYRFADRWQVYADYHYMFMDDPNLAYVDAPQDSIEIAKTDHSLLIGLRFDLQRDGAAPPPKQPDQPIASPKQFIVFFGFNKSNLTAEAAKVVADAAAAAKQYGSASISVVGHTDTSGSNEYNLRLSMARSAAVKAGLAANGIADSAISTSGKGEAELMVQTGDGVKEPQNRRATIDLN